MAKASEGQRVTGSYTRVEQSPRYKTLAFPEWSFSPGAVPTSAWALVSAELVVVLLGVQLLDVLEIPGHAGFWVWLDPAWARGCFRAGTELGLMLLLRC